MSDQHPTEPQPTEPPPEATEPGGFERPAEPVIAGSQPRSPEPPGGPRKLFRSRHDRVLGGICGGLGDYFDVDPVIVRIAFVASIFLGGLGIFAYLALWVFVPAAPVSPAEAQAVGSSSRPRGAVLGKIAIAVVALTALTVAAAFSAWAAATGHGVAVALIIVLAGAGMIATARRGNARWLIVPAIALAAPLCIVAASDISFADTIGERTYAPTNLADVPSNGYELGVGRMVVDLRNASWKPGTTQKLNLDLGVGEAVVAVPGDVCVSTDIDADAGELQIPGQRSEGFDTSNRSNTGAKATPRLDLTAHVDLGRIEVTNDANADLGDHPGSDSRRSTGSAADLRAACAGGQGKK